MHVPNYQSYWWLVPCISLINCYPRKSDRKVEWENRGNHKFLLILPQRSWSHLLASNFEIEIWGFVTESVLKEACCKLRERNRLLSTSGWKTEIMNFKEDNGRKQLLPLMHSFLLFCVLHNQTQHFTQTPNSSSASITPEFHPFISNLICLIH